MITSDALLARLATTPDDRILGLAAADALMDDTGCGRMTALRRVATARRDAVSGRWIADAARLIATHSPRRRIIADAILAAVGVADGVACTVYVIRGMRRPRIGVPVSDLHADPVSGLTVFVGAGWVLRRNRALLAQARAASDRRRGITRRR